MRRPCPGGGCAPAQWPNVKTGLVIDDGEAVCPRCGGMQKLRADGRIRAHRVDESSIIPMIRRPLASRRRA